MLLREQTGEQRIALRGRKNRSFSGVRDLVITTGGTLCSSRVGIGFPARHNQLISFESTQRRVHSSAGQTGGLHDVEPEAVAETQSLEDESGAMG